MTDWMLDLAFSNLCVALLIAAAAWTAQTIARRPFLAHMLCVLALLELLTPPLVSFPVVAPAPLAPADLPALLSSAEVPVFALQSWKTVLLSVWLLGSVCLLLASLRRVVRFNHLVKSSSTEAGPELRRAAAEIAYTLGLRAVPAVRITPASISPIVWWIGGRVRVLIPSVVCEGLSPEALRWILAHELAHVRRGDHLTRWLEWLVCVWNWWNPVAWWVRRHLRINEEICCDALVLSTIGPPSRSYASSLVSALEILGSPSLRPPATASRINGGLLERRIKMILSSRSIRTTPRWLRRFALLCAAAVLPFGFSLAQNAGNLDRVQSWLQAGVNSAYLTQEQANVMLNALRKPSHLQKRDVQVAHFRKATANTEQLVASGKITAEEGRRRIETLTKELAKQGISVGLVRDRPHTQ